MVGTEIRGIKTPIINTGDDLVSIVTESLVAASKQNNFEVDDGDIVAVTEAVVAGAQGNIATLEQTGKDLKNKFKTNHLGISFPIMSRNRFFNILKAATDNFETVSVLLRNPSDEMGNRLIDANPYLPDVSFYTANEFYKAYGKPKHRFTGVDYIELYEKAGAKVYLSRDPKDILKLTDNVLVATVHDREEHKKYLLDNGAKKVLTLAEILNKSVDGSGYNKEYGLLGCNKRGEDKLKLFPRDGQEFVEALQKSIKNATGATVHTMIYGDGAFKDPVGGIWELNDPVVSPAFTSGLAGASKGGLKLKNEVVDLPKDKQEEMLKKLIIKYEKGCPIDDPKALGSTPRQISDLVGSLADLTTGSSDKGTPFVHIKGYFDDYIHVSH